MMIYLLVIILDSLLTQLQHGFSNLSPAAFEAIKVIAVSVSWVGGLATFMWWKDKRKHQPVAY